MGASLNMVIGNGIIRGVRTTLDVVEVSNPGIHYPVPFAGWYNYDPLGGNLLASYESSLLLIQWEDGADPDKRILTVYSKPIHLGSSVWEGPQQVPSFPVTTVVNPGGDVLLVTAIGGSGVHG